MKTDTIAAIATAMSSSGIGIIRISGDDAFSVIDRIYRSKNGKKKLSDCESHTIHYGYIYDGEEAIDEVMVLLMRAPKSYTSEDTVEIDCHGGVYVMKRILDTVLRNGARCAEPGEFTKRAFLNGRLDLTQAEAVIDVINSKNEYALKSSLNQLHGSVLTDVKKLRENLIHEIAFIESALDDPEHISLDGYQESLLPKIQDMKETIKYHLDTAGNGMMLKEGICTAIIGKPNAGKSSLLNTLARKERAIVTDIAGTTRDTLEEQIMLNGICLNIIDTAGIRDTEDSVEKIGVEKAMDSISMADLILYVVDSSTDLDENDFQIMEHIKNKNVIVLLNKSDLEVMVSEEKIKENLNAPVLSFSAKNGDGLEQLENLITDMFFKGSIQENNQVIITNARHVSALSRAYESLSHVVESIENEMPEDFLSIDLMDAYESLGTIIGESVEEDLVNEIFSKFCTGK